MPAIVATNALLADARKQYHALVTGAAARVVVDQNGERCEFVAANKQALLSYITLLEQQLGVACGATPTPMAQYHPATFIF
jgi:hypothetical protein